MGRPHHPAAGSRFSHTRNSVYLSALFALCCVGYDSTHVRRMKVATAAHWGQPVRCTPLRVCCQQLQSATWAVFACLQDIIQRSHINKKWFYLFGESSLRVMHAPHLQQRAPAFTRRKASPVRAHC